MTLLSYNISSQTTTSGYAYLLRVSANNDIQNNMIAPFSVSLKIKGIIKKQEPKKDIPSFFSFSFHVN